MGKRMLAMIEEGTLFLCVVRAKQKDMAEVSVKKASS
jgi:hypothetical protein